MQDASSSHHASLVQEAVTRLRALYGNRLKAVYQCTEPLYADDDDAADMDFIVVLTGTVDPWQEVRPLSEVASDIGLEHTAVVLFFPVGESNLDAGGWQIADGIQHGLRVA